MQRKQQMHIDKNGTQVNIHGMQIGHCYESRTDEHGVPITRTPETHPYNYDGFVLHRFGANKEANDTIYSDRLMQWDFTKHDRLLMEVFGDKGQYWNRRDPKLIEKFLQLWCEKPDVKLILVMEYCNQASGYPCWRFDFFNPPVIVETPNENQN